MHFYLMHHKLWSIMVQFNYGAILQMYACEIHLFEAKESERKRAAAKIKKQKEAENKKLEEKRKINDEKFKEWLK